MIDTEILDGESQEENKKDYESLRIQHILKTTIMSKEKTELNTELKEKALQFALSVVSKGTPINERFTTSEVLTEADLIYAWLTKEETDLDKQKLDWIKGQ